MKDYEVEGERCIGNLNLSNVLLHVHVNPSVHIRHCGQCLKAITSSYTVYTPASTLT